MPGSVPHLADILAGYEAQHLAVYGQPLDRPWTYDGDAINQGNILINIYNEQLRAYNAANPTAPAASEIPSNSVADLPVSVYAASLPSEHKGGGGFFSGGLWKAIAVGGAIALGAGALGAFAEGAAAADVATGAAEGLAATDVSGAATALELGTDANVVVTPYIDTSVAASQITPLAPVTSSVDLFSALKNAQSASSFANSVSKMGSTPAPALITPVNRFNAPAATVAAQQLNDLGLPPMDLTKTTTNDTVGQVSQGATPQNIATPAPSLLDNPVVVLALCAIAAYAIMHGAA